MKSLLWKVLLPVGLIAIFFWAVLSQFSSESYLTQPVKSLKTPQMAAVHYGYPIDGKPLPKVNPRFDLFDSFTRAKIPLAEHFDSPMGTQNGGFIYNAQAFAADNPKRGGFHLGDDLNGIGGENTDLGDPVFAAADGYVVYSAKPSEGWGNVIVIAHRLRDGRLVQTFYSHLRTISASVGNLVGRGQQIGTVGSAKGRYFAHLHYEIRESDGVVIGAGYAKDRDHLGECLDPTEFVAKYNRRDSDDIRESALKMMLEIDRENLMNSLNNQILSQ